jgi:acetyl esterase/lipase
VSLDPQARKLLAFLGSLGDPPLEQSMPAEARARRRARIPPTTTELPDVLDLDANGVPVRLYRPGDAPGLFVYFHGGGWVLGDLDTHDHVARAFAAASGQAVLAADYRLAPEHPFPSGLDDAHAVARWAHANAATLGCDAARLAIGGDSAGGNLAAVVTQTGDVPFAYQVLLYPVTDTRGTGSYRTHDDPSSLLTGAEMRWFLDHYLSGGAGSTDDPRVSPLLAGDDALRRSPPTLVLTAEHDPLRDEGEAYGERLRSLGTPAQIERFDGMFHGFVSFLGSLDGGRRAIELVGAALRSALEPSATIPSA